MQVIRSVEEMKSFVGETRRAAKSLALVPTMGALHNGHLSLVRKAKNQCDTTVVSIFVNPTQFGPSEDLERYPRNLEKDVKALMPFNVSAAFVPSVEEMYPVGFATTVDPGAIGRRLEGASRPDHFRGVATVVLKLFNIVMPDRAYFGQKDFQQTVVISGLVKDFNLGVRMVLCPIVRDGDGVAVSSRNIYLAAEERVAARALNRSLEKARKLVWGGEILTHRVMGEMRRLLGSDSRVGLDYLEIVDPGSLNSVERITAGCLALVAVKIGSTRLIDNTILGPFGASEEDLLRISRANHCGAALPSPKSLQAS
ncbi:MAG TPA: pantoate--beta-alanine ligase [Terriglobia bacterium]|nr:pantoate--beta-alanine ligase [Terriglobia bacterium]